MNSITKKELEEAINFNDWLDKGIEEYPDGDFGLYFEEYETGWYGCLEKVKQLLKEKGIMTET